MIEHAQTAAVFRREAGRIARYTPVEAKTVFGRKAEFALLDVREQEEFSRGHMLLASCAPLSHLESLAGDLVPCRRTRIILVDSGQETCRPRAARAA
jgi:rhodanese-related sulfurtransferase